MNECFIVKDTPAHSQSFLLLFIYPLSLSLSFFLVLSICHVIEKPLADQRPSSGGPDLGCCGFILLIVHAHAKGSSPYDPFSPVRYTEQSIDRIQVATRIDRNTTLPSLLVVHQRLAFLFVGRSVSH